MSAESTIGHQVAQIAADVATTLPAGTTLDLDTLRLDLPHDAGPIQIEQALRAALAQKGTP